MFRLPLIALALGLILSFGTPAKADTDVPVITEQMILDTIRKNPEIVMEAIQILRAREETAQARQQAEALAMLGSDSTSPFAGNPDGDVILVEFFDYQCGFCKRVFPQLADLIEQDGNLKVIFKELPIVYPPLSDMMARVALAAREQDKYMEVHTALMTTRGGMSEDKVFKIASDLGLDMDKLRADMTSEVVESEIQANIALAQSLGVGGTPAFVLDNRVIPGAPRPGQLEEMIQEIRDRKAS